MPTPQPDWVDRIARGALLAARWCATPEGGGPWSQERRGGEHLMRALGTIEPRGPAHSWSSWSNALLYTAPDRIEPVLTASRADAPPVWPIAGRLMVAYVEYSFLSRASAKMSNHFIDDEDLPPCDLWVLVLPIHDAVPTWEFHPGDALISWIPEQCVPRAQAGMNVDPVASFRWLSDVSPALNARVRSAMRRLAVAR